METTNVYVHNHSFIQGVTPLGYKTQASVARHANCQPARLVALALSAVMGTRYPNHHLCVLALSASTSLLICAALLRLASSSLHGPEASVNRRSFRHHQRPR